MHFAGPKIQPDWGTEARGAKNRPYPDSVSTGIRALNAPNPQENPSCDSDRPFGARGPWVFCQ
jgi:hypothetical protein